MVRQPASLFAPRVLWRALLKGGPDRAPIDPRRRDRLQARYGVGTQA
jgi:hypothetical protein